jgi:hypothetical protein
METLRTYVNLQILDIARERRGHDHVPLLQVRGYRSIFEVGGEKYSDSRLVRQGKISIN